jgi:hypothetical protein
MELPRTSYPRLGGLTARAFVAPDNDHLLLGFLAGYVHVLQSRDGGAGWVGLDDQPRPTRCYHNANAPSHAAEAAGNDLLYLYTDHCAGGGSPSNLFFRKVAFTGRGWKLEPPRLVDVDCRHCPEWRVEVLRLANGRIWAAWMHLDRFGKTGVRARFSDDGGLTWRDPDSNAMLIIDRDDSQGPQRFGVTLWTDDTPPIERANGRVGAMFAHGGLTLIPYRGTLACVWNDTWHPLAKWSVFRDGRWSEPVRIELGKGKPGSAAAVGDTLYLVFADKVHRLDGQKWVADTPPGARGGLLTAAGDDLYCFWATLASEGKEHHYTIHASHKHAGQWSEPRILATEIVIAERPYLGLTAPRRVSGSFIPLAWGPQADWIKYLRLPLNPAGASEARE